MAHKYIVFCDFDGTIIEEDTMLSILLRFVPEGYDQMVEAIKAGTTTLSKELPKLFALIKSDCYRELVHELKKFKIRPGFSELLDYLKEKEIPFVIISGGISGIVEANVSKEMDKITSVHAAGIDLSEQYMHLSSSWDDGFEIVSKPEVMKRYNYEKAICIGDGYTDMGMSERSDIVFARDLLAEILLLQNKDFFLWEDFFDIRQHLEKIGI